MIAFLLNLWKVVQLVYFIVSSLPTIFKGLKQVWEFAFGDKKVAKDCVNDLCCPNHLKQHVEKSERKGKGPIR
jgi:hypothetical protein